MYFIFLYFKPIYNLFLCQFHALLQFIFLSFKKHKEEKRNTWDGDLVSEFIYINLKSRESVWTKKHERDHQECSNLLPRCCLVLTREHHWLLKMRVRAKEQWLVTLKGSGAWHCSTVVWNGQQLNLPHTLSFPLASLKNGNWPPVLWNDKTKQFFFSPVKSLSLPPPFPPLYLPSSSQLLKQQENLSLS